MQVVFVFYEGKPEDKSNVADNFYYIIFDTFESQHQTGGVNKGSNKKSSAINLFQVCDSKKQEHYIFQEEMKIPKRRLGSSIDSLRKNFKFFNEASKCLKIPLPSPKIEIGPIKSRDSLFAD